MLGETWARTTGAIIGGVDGFGPSTYGDAFADIYDDWYADLGDLDGCVDALTRLAGPGPAVEIGVGTGRVAGPLAARGVLVVGVDASDPMLERLGARWPSVRGVRADAASLPLRPGSWCRVLYAAYNTFWSIGGPEAQSACLAAAARCLHPEGHVVLEGFVPGTAPDRPTSSVEVTRMTTGSLVLLASREDPTRQELEGQHVHITEAGIRLRPWRVRYLTNEQLDDLAAEAGLELEARWGAWDGRPLGPDDAVAVSVYRRTPA